MLSTLMYVRDEGRCLTYNDICKIHNPTFQRASIYEKGVLVKKNNTFSIHPLHALSSSDVINSGKTTMIIKNADIRVHYVPKRNEKTGNIIRPEIYISDCSIDTDKDKNEKVSSIIYPNPKPTVPSLRTCAARFVNGGPSLKCLPEELRDIVFHNYGTGTINGKQYASDVRIRIPDNNFIIVSTNAFNIHIYFPRSASSEVCLDFFVTTSFDYTIIDNYLMYKHVSIYFLLIEDKKLVDHCVAKNIYTGHRSESHATIMLHIILGYGDVYRKLTA